jgi:tRNA (Thr-GGU) A37 N-methylase
MTAKEPTDNRRFPMRVAVIGAAGRTGRHVVEQALARGDEVIAIAKAPEKPPHGAFATRSPDRPSPIGLHRVTVTEIQPPAQVHIDAMGATAHPSLDLKVALNQAPDA